MNATHTTEPSFAHVVAAGHGRQILIVTLVIGGLAVTGASVNQVIRARGDASTTTVPLSQPVGQDRSANDPGGSAYQQQVPAAARVGSYTGSAYSPGGSVYRQQVPRG